MEYTNKQLNKILSLKEFLEITNTLSEVYKSYNDKKISVKNDIDKSNIYKVFCGSLFNTLDGIIKCKEFFNNCIKFDNLNNLLNQVYITEDKEIYNKVGYKTTLYKMLRETRNLYNHFEKEENDETMLYEVYIDLNILEEIRKLANDIFYEFYKNIDAKCLKNVEINRKKIKYRLGLLNNSIVNLENKIIASNNRIDKIYERETKESIALVKKTFEPGNLYDLFNGDKSAIEEFNNIDSKISGYYKKAKNEVEKNGSDNEKKVMQILDEFMKSDEEISYKEREENFERMIEDVKRIISDEKEDE